MPFLPAYAVCNEEPPADGRPRSVRVLWALCKTLMHDNTFASHTFMVGTCMLTHIHTRQLSCDLWPEINYKQTCNTHFQGITDNNFEFGRPYFAPQFFTHPPCKFPLVHNRFCPSKWWVDGSLHKDMRVTSLGCDRRRMWASDYSKFLLPIILNFSYSCALGTFESL